MKILKKHSRWVLVLVTVLAGQTSSASTEAHSASLDGYVLGWNDDKVATSSKDSGFTEVDYSGKGQITLKAAQGGNTILHYEHALGESDTEELKDLYGSEPINLSREDLANFIGTAPETVIRLLSEMKTERLIAVKGRKITVLDQASIEKMSLFS